MEKTLDFGIEGLGDVPDDNFLTNADWSSSQGLNASNSTLLLIAVEYVRNESFKLDADTVATGYELEKQVSSLDPNMSSAARYSPIHSMDPISPVVILQNGPSPAESGQYANAGSVIYQGSGVEGAVGDAGFFQCQAAAERHPDAKKGELSAGKENCVFPMHDSVELLIPDREMPFNYMGQDYIAPQTIAAQLCDEQNLSSSICSPLNQEEAIKTNFLPDDKTLNEDLIDAAFICSNSTLLANRSANFIEEAVVPKEIFCGEKIEENTKEIEEKIESQIEDEGLIFSFPSNLLAINRLSSDMKKKDEYGVFAKKFVPANTKFGPLVVKAAGAESEETNLQLSVEIEEDNFQYAVIEEENESKWMNCIRKATNYREQNVELHQDGNALFFTTTKPVYQRQELLVGYSENYAIKRNLPFFKLEDNALKGELKDLQNDVVGSRKFKRICSKYKIFGAKKKFKCSDSVKYKITKYIKRKNSLLDDEVDENVCLKEETYEENAVSDEGKEKPSKVSAYKCHLCYKVFSAPERLQQHMLVHGSEDSKPIKCEFCPKRFLNNSALACHIKSHSSDKKAFDCPICKECFEQVFQLKDHIRSHCVDGIYFCPHCPKEFKEYSTIRKHIRAFHSALKHICQFCDKLFPTTDKLRMHLLKHSDHKEFLCADCGKQFKRKDKLKEHMKKMHSEEGPRPEGPRGGDGGSPSSAVKFMPKVQPTDYHRFIYKCHTCFLGFKRRGMLVNHLAKRHPDISLETVPELNLPILKATRDYFCQHCDKVYKSSSKRKAHILKKHPGAELPLSNRCVRQMATPDASAAANGLNATYSQTVGSVTTDPHACQWCHKQYASKAKLLQHQRKKHLDLLPKAQRQPRLFKYLECSTDEDAEEVHSEGRNRCKSRSKDIKSTAAELIQIEKIVKTGSGDIMLADVSFEGGNQKIYRLVQVPAGEAIKEADLQDTSQLYRLLTGRSSPTNPYPPP